MIISYETQIENKGWNSPVTDGATSGTIGQALRMEAIKISLLELNGLNLAMEYQSHVENYGWMPLMSDDQISGTVEEGLRLEAIRIRLVGLDAKKYSVKYRLHIENYGWQLWKKDGETAGTEGVALRAEAIEIRIELATDEVVGTVPPTTTIDPNTGIPVGKILCASYATHIENTGWGKDVTDGRLSGRVGQGKRMEAIRISLLNTAGLNLGVAYSTHIQNQGWGTEVANGQTSGTTDLGLRMEAIKIRLTGTDAAKYSVWYRVHVQNEAWQEWRRDGEIAGTVGQALRAEAIQILITLKTDNLIRTPGQSPLIAINYQTHIQNMAWGVWAKNGQKSGTTGLGLRMEAIRIKLSSLDSLNIGVLCRTHIENQGWGAWVPDDVISGTVGQSLRLEAVEIKLTGIDASKYIVKYRGHIENIGWTTWYQDGETLGTTGQFLRAEAISIVLIKKADLGGAITNEIKNKAPYLQIWAAEFPKKEVLLHDIRTDYHIFNPKLTEGINKVSGFNFTIDPTHEHYNSLRKMATVIYVYEVYSNMEKKQIFEGRILTDVEDFNKMRAVTCEGELAYLLDSTQRPATHENINVEQWLTMKLDAHNMSVTPDKRLYMGICTVLDTKDDALRENDCVNTLELINTTLLKNLGGVLQIEQIGSIKFLNYLENYGRVSEQPIQFGLNLLDYVKTTDASGIITALVPYGKEIDGRKLDISSVNDGADFIYNEVAVNQYGWITGYKEFPDITDAATLLQASKAYLDGQIVEGTSLEVTAVDLGNFNIDITKFEVGDMVPCISKPHNLNTFLSVSKKEQTLDDHSKDKLVLGAVTQSLTDRASGTLGGGIMGFQVAVSNSVKNMEFVSNELSFMVKITSDKVTETQNQLDEAEFKITAEAITSTVRSSIEYIGDIGGKASATDLNNVTSRVYSAEQKITAEAITSTVRSSIEYIGDIGGKASATDLNNVTSRVYSAEQKITATAITQTVRSDINYQNDLGQKITESQASYIAQTATNVQIGFNGIAPALMVVDANGLVINNGAFKIKNSYGVTVFSADAYGNLTLVGNVSGTKVTAKGILEVKSEGTTAQMDVSYNGARNGSMVSNAVYGLTLRAHGGMLLYTDDAAPVTIAVNTNIQGNLSAPNIPVTNTSGQGKVSSLVFVPAEGVSNQYLQISMDASSNGSAAKGIAVWQSDARIKTNITKSKVNAVESINKIDHYAFDWIYGGPHADCDYIAQEIEKSLGSKHILKIPQGNGDVSYQIMEKGFIPLLTKAVQELDATQKISNAKFQNEIARLKYMLEQQQSELNQLKQA